MVPSTGSPLTVHATPCSISYRQKCPSPSCVATAPFSPTKTMEWGNTLNTLAIVSAVICELLSFTVITWSFNVNTSMLKIISAKPSLYHSMIRDTYWQCSGTDKVDCFILRKATEQIYHFIRLQIGNSTRYRYSSRSNMANFCTRIINPAILQATPIISNESAKTECAKNRKLMKIWAKY